MSWLAPRHQTLLMLEKPPVMDIELIEPRVRMSCLREQPSSCNPLSWSSYSYIIIHSLHLILRRWQHICWPALPYSSFTKRLHRRGPVGLCHLYPLVLFPFFRYVWHVRMLLRSRWLFDAAADDNDDDVCIHTLGHWAGLQKIDFQGSHSRRREQSWDVMCKSHTDDYPSWHPLIAVGGEAVKFARMPALWELWAWCHVWKRCPKDMLTTGWLPQMQNWLNIERTLNIVTLSSIVMELLWFIDFWHLGWRHSEVEVGQIRLSFPNLTLESKVYTLIFCVL